MSVQARPGLRAFRSARFRTIVAVVLAIIGVALQVVLLTALSGAEMQWLKDFEAYLIAAGQLASGASPYKAEQLAGPGQAVCDLCLLYPPPLAQLLVPLTYVPLDLAKAAWFALMSSAAWLSVWIATGIGGARPTLERAAWSVVAVTFFLPVFHATWMGNVSTLIGLAVVLVARGGAVAGVTATLATVLKVVPATLAPVALVADRRARIAFVGSLLVVLPLSIVLSPGAWREYPTALLNLVTGSGDVDWNLAPAAIVARSTLPGVAAAVVRLLAIVGAMVAFVSSVWFAFAPRGLPLAVLLATIAMLLFPGAMWLHYLAIVLPLAAMAWPRAGTRSRIWLIGFAVVASLAGIEVLPFSLTLVAAAAMIVVSGWTFASWVRVGDAVDTRVVSLSSGDDDA